MYKTQLKWKCPDEPFMPRPLFTPQGARALKTPIKVKAVHLKQDKGRGLAKSILESRYLLAAQGANCGVPV